MSLALYIGPELVYLRNLPTHTVNNLLQKLNYVKGIQFFVVAQKFNITHIMCENFRTIPLSGVTTYVITLIS